jgi:hypothetical protein
MNRSWNLRLALLASLASAIVGPASAQQQQPKPNILFILADNVGHGDIGAYGGGELRGAPTPRIDQLGAESLRLTQFLVEPACTPSRAALMTGRYSIRSEFYGIPPADTWDAFGIIRQGRRHLVSFQEFPPRQRPGSFSVEQAMEKLRNPPSSN